jgi:hypothetical protein
MGIPMSVPGLAYDVGQPVRIESVQGMKSARVVLAPARQRMEREE